MFPPLKLHYDYQEIINQGNNLEDWKPNIDDDDSYDDDDNDNDGDVAAYDSYDGDDDDDNDDYSDDDDNDDDKYAMLTSGQRWPSFPKYWTDSEALP
jgi:hypothetical protein